MNYSVRLLLCCFALWLTSTAQAQSLTNGNYGAVASDGEVTCGGIGSDGKLQEPCGFKPAVFEGDAVGECPAGSFFDVGLWSCWSCPQGYDRTLAAVDTDRACAKPNPSKRGTFGRASFQGKVCPEGSFFDPTRDGECWSCPSGYNRTVAPVEWADACVKPAKENFKRINRHNRATGLLGTDCPSGQFWDARDGHCYSCPSGYNRTGYAVNHERACSQLVREQKSKATLVKKAQCETGEILDLRNGGECWTCPTAADRTVYPINGAKACETGGGFDYSTATKTAALTCPAGQIFDTLNSRNSRVREHVKRKYNGSFPSSVGHKGGGSCWSCPVGYRRTVLAVWDQAACESNGIEWKMPEYRQPGLFGLKGANEVVIALIKERTTIEAIAADLAKSLKKSEEDNIRDSWQEIHDAPESSGVLALAVLSRIEVAASSPGEASAAEKELLKSYSEAVVHFRTYLADQALQAYQAWDEADRKKNEVYSAVMIAGIGVAATATTFGTTAALYGMGAEAIRNELWPVPDFSELTLEAIIKDQLKGEAIGFVYTKVLLSDAVLKKFFPKSADLTAIRKTMTEAVERAQSTMAKYALQKASTEAASAAASAGAKVTSQAVLKAISAAGPQILADLAIETVIAWVELQIERANAEPRLNAMLADAKRPFDVKRLLATTKGVAEVEGQWTTVIAGTTSPADKAALREAVAEAMKASVNKADPQVAANFKALKWKSLGDKADAIFIGHDGDLYRLTKAGKGDVIEAYNAKNRSKPWTELASGYRAVAAGEKGELYLMKNDGTLATVKSDGKSLRKIDGGASQIVAVGEGDLWVVSDKLSGGEGDIWMMQGKRWSKKSGFTAQYLAAANGFLWGVKDNGDIYRSESGDSANILSSRMTKLDGKANGIAAGNDGAVMVVGTNQKLYGWDGINQSWLEIKPPSAHAQVVMKDSSTVYMLSEKGEIYQGQAR